jgi:abortive infection bacteriophage resistance protein
MDAIERVEVGLRTSATYHLSHAFGPYAHCDPAHFRSKFKHAEWLLKARQEAKSSQEVFVEHFQEKYDGFPDLPLWMATEILPFGGLSRLYSGMLASQQRPVAAEYGVHHAVLHSWLHTLNYIRNLCAHHARLWNRELAVGPEVPRHDPLWRPPITPTNRRVFFVLLILRQMMARQHEGRHWQQRVTDLITSSDLSSASRRAMGLPTNWLSHPLWDRTAPENARGG